MAKSIIQRLIDAGVCTHKDVEQYMDDYNNKNNKQKRLIEQQVGQASHEHVEETKHGVIRSTREYVSTYPIKPNLIAGGGKYFLPMDVKIVSAETFKDCKDLKEIDLSNVEVIGANAFLYCTNLRRVKFGKNLKIIDKYAFYGCENLEVIDLDIQGTKIHWTAFMRCPNWIEVSTILQAKSKAGEEVEWYH
ncbi:MAG: leucine-rich repeat domain-containing protein [Clostridia bacterium]